MYRVVSCDSYGSGLGGLGVFATPTNSRTIQSCALAIPPSPQGSVLKFGTTNMPGAKCNGNTYLALQGPDGRQVATSDDYGGGQCSFATLALPPAPQGATYKIVQGCYSGWWACSGTTVWALTLTMPPPPPPLSPSPPPPVVYNSAHLPVQTQQFQQRVIGHGHNNPHQQPSSTTSTETTASGNVNFWEDTSTTAASQRGTGNGHTTHQSTTTDTTATGHPVTNAVRRSPAPAPDAPAPVVYTSKHVRDAAGFSTFAGRVEGTNKQSHNNGATTSTTDSTASGVVNKWVTTTTTDETQRGTGNGNVVGSSTTTDTTATGNVVTHVTHHTHPSTTDLADTSVTVAPAPAPLCGGASFPVENPTKNLCLHIKGGVSLGGSFALAPNVKRPVITMKCVTGSPNQQFSWLPAAVGGQLRHDASGLMLSVADGTVRDGSAVTVLPAAAGAGTQAWVWGDPVKGGTLSSAADPQFQLTDAVVNAGAAVGLPVHLWHLAASLPSGAPNGAWMAGCTA